MTDLSVRDNNVSTPNFKRLPNMNFLLKKELKGNASQVNRYVSISNPKSHSRLKQDEAVESSIKLWECSYGQESDEAYPNFQEFLRTHPVHASIYPLRSPYNAEGDKVSCIFQIENSNVGHLRVFLPPFDFTNCLVLMGCSQQVTLSCELFGADEVEANFENTVNITIDVDKLDISFLG
ncbi:hypothetical protein M0D69_13915 [Caballeronia sp. SEWSISQ10-4 2]|uniref:hypothetical protein n=1 Tax=Caballeronia sp. SEWSISQ10-4 2 TaxID=2937438 RepID=UPI0026537FE5|nr:hypothetical protein [Caballeronia sp. SEWSISQ10-4 2]MDN7179090.1 hypothetical protein [Caballeronia sp. SEWSISQ10-4 2]